MRINETYQVFFMLLHAWFIYSFLYLWWFWCTHISVSYLFVIIPLPDNDKETICFIFPHISNLFFNWMYVWKIIYQSMAQLCYEAMYYEAIIFSKPSRLQSYQIGDPTFTSHNMKDRRHFKKIWMVDISQVMDMTEKHECNIWKFISWLTVQS